MSIYVGNKDAADIPRNIFNKNNHKNMLKKQTFCNYDTDNDYILYEIMRRGHIEYERQMHKNEIYIYENKSCLICLLLKCMFCLILFYPFLSWF